MKIISKFKDYYDGGASFGVDTERQYVRVINEIPISNFPYKFDVIGFCGKIYPFNNVTDFMNRNPKEWTNYDPSYEFKLSKDEHNCDIYTRQKITKSNKESWQRFSRYNSNTWMTKKEAFEYVKHDQNLLEIFHVLKVPIFHIGRYKAYLTLNPCLKDLGFYKIFDTVQAWQEIEMYISNQLVFDRQGDIPVGNDNVIRDSKGFDKWTFRKEKQS